MLTPSYILPLAEVQIRESSGHMGENDVFRNRVYTKGRPIPGWF